MEHSARVLVVEDDDALARWISDYLIENSFQVEVFADGECALASVRQSAPDLILLDINLPGINGFDVCRELRQFYQQPIIMVTANDEEFDEILGLELGANDYITKPVTPRVLLARIKSQLRQRDVDSHDPQNRLVFGSLEIDFDSQTVMLEDEIIALSSGEFELLWVLASQAGSELKRDELIRQIRGFDYDGFDRTIDVRISRLRKKLKDTSNPPQRIKTIWGKGYLFVKNTW